MKVKTIVIITVLVIVFIVVFVILTGGRGNTDFVGLKPLDPNYNGPYKMPGLLVEKINITREDNEVVDNNENNENNENITVNEPEFCNNESAWKSLPKGRDGYIKKTLNTVKYNENIDLTPNIPDDLYDLSVGKMRHGKGFVSKGQRICCDVLSKFYDGEMYQNYYPSWLKNPETNRLLELDCYNKKHKIAVEYSGIHHYVHPNYTKQSKEDFEKQLRRDRLKLDLCDKNGVYLITVPYNIKHCDIEKFIISQLPQNYKSE